MRVCAYQKNSEKNMKKTVSLFGKDVPLVFNVAAQILYEKVTDKAFDLADMPKVEARMALAWAMIATADAETDVTLEKLAYEVDVDGLNALDACMNALISEWYHIPSPAQKDEPEEEQDPKND